MKYKKKSVFLSFKKSFAGFIFFRSLKEIKSTTAKTTTETITASVRASQKEILFRLSHSRVIKIC